MRLPVHYVANLVVLHRQRVEVVPLVVHVVAGLMSRMRLRNVHDVADKARLLVNRDRMDDHAFNSRLYCLDDLLKPFFGDIRSAQRIEPFRHPSVVPPRSLKHTCRTASSSTTGSIMNLITTYL